MGLPLRIALPVLAVLAAVFLAVMGYLISLGLGNSGAALGRSAPAEQGDARIQATPAPAVAIATDPPGTFSIPQTGTGPIAPSSTLPGNTVGGGGPPAPVMQALSDLRARLKANPNDLAALVALANLYFDANKFEQALPYYRRALALDPTNPDVRTDYATALHGSGHDIEALTALDAVLKSRPRFTQALYNRAVVLQAIGRRTDAVAAYTYFIKVAPNDQRAAEARAAVQQIGS